MAARNSSQVAGGSQGKLCKNIRPVEKHGKLLGQRQRVNAAVIPEGGDGGGIKALLRLGEPVEGRQIPDRAPGGQVDGIGIAHKQRHIRPHTGHHRFDQAALTVLTLTGIPYSRVKRSSVSCLMAWA